MNRWMSARWRPIWSKPPLRRCFEPRGRRSSRPDSRVPKNFWRAIQIAPADARSLAYMGMIRLADNQPDEAVPCFMAAAALHEAVARQIGASTDSSAMPALPPSFIGLTCAIDLKLAPLLTKTNHADVLLPLLRQAVSLGNRVPKSDWYFPVALSMLPGENPDVTTVMPAAMNTATLMAWIHLNSATALNSQGKRPEAMAEYAATMRCQTEVPPTADVGTMIREPVAVAAMELGRAYLAQGNAAAAVETLSGHGPTYQQNPKLNMEYNDLLNQAVQAANRQGR